MKKIILILTVAALSSLSLQAQNDPIVIEVDGQKIRQSEFMKEFNANVGNQLAEKKGVTETEKRLALEEYAAPKTASSSAVSPSSAPKNATRWLRVSTPWPA